jgi:signal transduction histidine kinase
VNSELENASDDPARANKLELIERLADDLAHEIKNPLHSMVINLEVLRRRIARAAGESPDDQLRYVGVIAGELERVNRHVDLLLQLARPNRGRETTTLPELIHEYQELITLECERRGIAFEYEADAAFPRGRVSRDLAGQVVLNLLLDGIDRTPPGGSLRVRIESDADWARLHLRLAQGAEGGNGREPPEPGERRLAMARVLSERLGGRLEEVAQAPGAVEEGNFRPAFVLSFPLKQ